MAKLGRPLKEQTNLSHDVKVRLDDETFAKLIAYCGNDKQKAEVIREALKAYLNKAT